MKKAVAVALILAAAATALRAQSDFELRLGEETGRPGVESSIPILLSSVTEVQGLVVVFEWDGAVATGQNIVAGQPIQTADLFVSRVEANYIVLGVVMDSDGANEEVIPPGEDIEVASVKLTCLDVAAETSTALSFVDGKYATVDGGPLLDNLLTVDSESIKAIPAVIPGGGAPRLVLQNGLLTCRVAEDLFFKVANAVADPRTGCGVASVLMDNSQPIEAYVVALGHPAGLDLQSIAMGSAGAANGADFQQADLFADGGTLGVVLDLDPPFEGNVIPPGGDQEIATYSYCCVARPGAGEPPEVFDLIFVDDQLGQPTKRNTGVVGGESVFPAVENGTFTCPPIVVPTGGQAFACGGDTLGADGLPVGLEAQLGSEFELSFYYRSEEDNAPGGPQFDQVQGLSMAVCYPCELQCQEGSFDISGTIVEAVGADFVSHQCDNDPADRDGCELIIGILVDSLPPFDGNTLPPTDRFLSIGRLTFSVEDKPEICGRCLQVTFCDGIDGRGNVPIKNLVSVENESRSPELLDCEVCVVGEAVFFRGDCNFSRAGPFSVDISDPAALVAALFLEGQQSFDPPCLDACDCNDDGRLDLADVNCILNYLFRFGQFPPPPGPGLDEAGNPTAPGPDPTEDLLDCAGGTDCA